MASTSLTWALAASIAAHSAFLAFPLRDRNVAAGASGQRSALEVTFVDTQDTSLRAAETPSVEPLLVATVQTPTQSPTPPPIATVAAPIAAAVDAAGGSAPKVEIESKPLFDRSVLGALFTRQQTEFPIEIDFPPQIEGKIVATFPATALARRAERAVAVWIVVDESGSPEEIQVAEGDEEFADAIVAAIKTARFRPAQNHHVPIRFPISLEFRLASDAPKSVGAARTAANR